MASQLQCMAALLCAKGLENNLGIAIEIKNLWRRGHAGIALPGLIVLGRHIFSSPIHVLYNDAALLFILALFGGLIVLALRMGNAEHCSPPPMMGVSPHAAMALSALLLLVLGYTHS